MTDVVGGHVGPRVGGRCDDEAKDPAAPVPGLHWALDAVRRVAEQRARGRHGQPRGAGA
ncbi:MAG TPA: hypothetical protein VGP05_00230 [Pseudonocardia sp.]|nr:hypothetical protein [Pseudonocardia sp.]